MRRCVSVLVLALAALCAIVIEVAECGSAPPFSAPEPDPFLRMLVWENSDLGNIKASVARFVDLEKNNVTGGEVLGSPPPLLDPYMAYFASDFSAADVMPTSYVLDAPELLSSHFEDVTSILSKSGLDTDLIGAARAKAYAPDGTGRAVPMTFDGTTCIYSNAVMDRILGTNASLPGKEFTPPTTWSEMLDLCQVLEQTAPPIPGLAPFSCFSISTPFVPPTVYFDYLAIRMFGSEFYSQFSAGQISLVDDPRVAVVFKAFQQFLPLIKSTDGPRLISLIPGAPPPTGGTTRLYDIGEFITGSAGFVCEFASFFNLVEIFGMLDPADVGYFAFPEYDLPVMDVEGSGAVPDGTNAELALFFSFGVPQNAPHVEAGTRLLEHLASPEEHAIFAASTGLLPVRKSLNHTVTVGRRKFVFDVVQRADSVHGRSYGYTGDFGVSGFWIFLMNDLLATSGSDAEVEPLLGAQLPVLDALRVSVVYERAADPSFDPPGGAFSMPVQVSISTLTPGAVLLYTLDGTEPTLGSPVYSGPFEVGTEGTTSIRAVAFADGLASSQVVRVDYVVTLPEVAALRVQRGPKDDSSTKLVLAIVLPLVAVCFCLAAAVGYVIYRRKSVTYRLASDSDLVIDTSDIAIGSPVGRGSFGTVYKGQWRGTMVAVKQMHDTTMGQRQLSEFVSEASVLLSLRHPHILTFMGVPLEPLAIVTEFMSRGSLYDIIHNANIFIDPSIVFKWAHAMASGLHFLEHAGIVHGDFKSLNVLFDTNWTLKLCDFGLSSVRPPSAAETAGIGSKGGRAARRVAPLNGDLESGNADAGGDVGTLFWAAPEILAEGMSPTTASDAYALGITLWELATRSELYSGRNPIAVALDVVRGERPDIGLVPTHMNALIPIMSSLWDQRLESRMTVGTSVTMLHALCPSDDALIFPSTSINPTGHVFCVHMVVRGWSEALVALGGDGGIVDDLVAFDHDVSGFATICSGVVIERNLGRATVVFHGPSAAGAFLDKLISSPWGDRVACTVTEGDILSATDEAGIRTLSGPVMDSLSSLWTLIFGSERPSHETGLGTVDTSESGGSVATPLAAVGVFAGFATATAILSETKSLSTFDVEGTTSAIRLGMVGSTAPDLALSTTLATPPPSHSQTGGSVLLTLLTRFQVAELVGDVEDSSVLGSYSRMYTTTWNGETVLVKVLFKQEHTVASLARVAKAILQSATLSELAGYRGLGPVAMCVEEPYICMVIPRLEHGSLASMLNPILEGSATAEDTGLTIKTGLSILHDVAVALTAIHAGGKSHGALKPTNILVSPDSAGSLRGILVDGGLNDVKSNMGTMTMVPSVAYQSPEDLRGMDESSGGDAFVMGTLLYEVVARVPAFSGQNAIEVATRILSGARPDLASIVTFPPDLRSLIALCWQDDVNLRPSCADVGAQLEAILSGL